jgi:hypothetical protein
LILSEFNTSLGENKKRPAKQDAKSAVPPVLMHLVMHPLERLNAAERRGLGHMPFSRGYGVTFIPSVARAHTDRPLSLPTKEHYSSHHRFSPFYHARAHLSRGGYNFIGKGIAF